MPTSPITFNALSNEDLRKAAGSFGSGLGNLYNQQRLNRQSLKLAEGTDLGNQINQLQGTQGFQGTQGVTGPSPEQQTFQGPQQQGEQFFPNVQPAQSVEQTESLRPLRPPVPQAPMTPQETNKIRADLIRSGITNRDLQDEYIRRQETFRKEKYEAEKEGYTNIEQARLARQAENARFQEVANPYLQATYGTMSPQERNIWEGLSRLSENAGSDEARLAQTDRQYQNLVGNSIQGFQQNAPSLPYGSLFQPSAIKSRLEDAKEMVSEQLRSIDRRQDLPPALKGEIKSYLREAYTTSLAEKDWGSAQAAYATSDLGDNFRKSVPKALPEVVKSYLPPQKHDQIKQKEIFDLANSFQDLRPEDSLVLAREKAIENNFTDADFREAMNVAMRSGRWTPSDFQRKDLDNLSIPQRLDLNSIMEGKRSIWDLFKAKK